MKNTFPSLLPALALLTLGSCAGTAALSTTESDGIYYSSKDRTSQNVRTVAAGTRPEDTQPESGDEISNPDYAGQSNRSSSSASGSTEYYDDGLSYSARIRRFHQPYYSGFGYGYNDFIYTDPFWYGGPAFVSYSPWGWGPGYYGGFYDPFWGPGWGGSFVNINIGFGNPWCRPWGFGRGFGYSRGFYDGFYSGYYGGGYGYAGFGNGGFYGGSLGNGRAVRYAPRGGRSLEATTQGRGVSSGGTGTAGNGGRGRVSEGGLVAPGGGGGTTNGVVGSGNTSTIWGGRVAETNTSINETGGVRSSQVRTLSDAEVKEREAKVREGLGNESQLGSSGAGRVGSAPDEAQPQRTGRGWRVLDNSTSTGSQPSGSPDYSQPRRSRAREIFNSGSGSNPSEADQNTEQPMRRQRAYEAPQQRQQRTYEAPQRSYEAPQRTYEAPQRSYEAPQRSYDAPSRGGSSGGGGNSGGGGGRGGRGRVE